MERKEQNALVLSSETADDTVKRSGKAIQLILRGILFVRFERLELVKFRAAWSAGKIIFYLQVLCWQTGVNYELRAEKKCRPF